MPIVSADIKTYKSINTDSDGGAIDTSRLITSGVDNNLFPDITGAELTAGGTRYRKCFRKNEHASLSWLNVRSYAPVQPSNATVSIGVGIDHADDADGLQGNMTAFSAAAKVALVSNGADTRTATILGERSDGVYQTEAVVLNGAAEVVSVLTFGAVYAVYLSALDGARTVTVRQGASGTTRGTIGPNKKICWLWRATSLIDTYAEGFKHGNILATGTLGIWVRKVWAAGAAAGTAFTFRVNTDGDSS